MIQSARSKRKRKDSEDENDGHEVCLFLIPYFFIGVNFVSFCC